MTEQQELQEQREQEAMSALVKVAFGGFEEEAETLAAQLGLYHQFKKEIANGTHCKG